jgi:hypothetical protein
MITSVQTARKSVVEENPHIDIASTTTATTTTIRCFFWVGVVKKEKKEASTLAIIT